VDEAAIRNVLSAVDRTAWIITSSHGDALGGLVATFVSEASLVPAMPRLAVGIARHHHTWELISQSGVFAAHLVDEANAELLWSFGLGSGRERDKFAGVRWRRAPSRSPLLEGALAWLDCAVEAALDIGDRTIFVAAVVDGNRNRPGAPITANRVMELAGDERRSRLDEERRRDEKLDAAAILRWRAAPR
jgi:flavin reductase (DIM6/NTAB) family NADH-FMN oxidoreductase RutF